jgi:hypothetical protein
MAPDPPPASDVELSCIKSTETGDVYNLNSCASSHIPYLVQDPAWTKCSSDERLRR